MSRSNNTELINPATRFFDWSGSEGSLRYFDKSLGEKGANVTVDLPFKFLILDRVAQVTGGIERHGSYSGFWSNAVRNTKVQPFIVRSKGGVEVQGLYEHIKGYPGVKFMQGLYIAFYAEDGALEIGYLKLKGAALSAWFDFVKTHRDIYVGAFGIEGSVKQKKGATTYYAPTFKHYSKVSDEADETAKMLDRELQEYLSAYFAQTFVPEERALAAAAGSDEFYEHEPEMPIGDVNADDEPEFSGPADDGDSIPF